MRHENIILVILGYVIGFTTAFIGFGVGVIDTFEGGTPSFFRDGIAPDVVSVTTNQASASEVPKLVKKNTGLYISRDGTEQIISGALSGDIKPGPGFHYNVLFSELSPTNDYVYYCEQETSNQASCNHYIYDVSKHISYLLRSGSEFLNPISDQIFFWTSDGLLSNNEMISVSSSEPWNLISLDTHQNIDLPPISQ